MQITFLRPELEKLHNMTRELFAMMGDEVSINTFSYELSYARHDPFAEEGLYMDALLPYLAQHLSAGASILDIGGGTGRVAIPLAKAGYCVTILDPAASGLRRAHEKAEAAGVADRLSYVCGEATDIRVLGEEAFDAVLGIQSVLFEEDLRSILAKMLPVSRKLVCFDVVNRHGFLASRMPGFQVNPANMLHVMKERATPGKWTLRDEQYPCYTRDELSSILEDTGMRVDEIRPESYAEVYNWQGGSQEEAAELDRRLRADSTLSELSGFYLVLGRIASRSRVLRPVAMRNDSSASSRSADSPG